MMSTKVKGKKRGHKVFIYTLSTCGWCKRTKQFLSDSDVEYEYIDVDKCTPEERRAAIQRLQEKKAPIGFPVIIIDGERIISGFKPEEIKEALGL